MYFRHNPKEESHMQWIKNMAKISTLILFLALIQGCKNKPPKPPTPTPAPTPTPTPTPSVSDDRVLLIGINAYPHAPLNGCVNDIVDMKAFLIKNYGFKEEQIKVLKDGDATTNNIHSGLNWLVSNARAGDRRFIHYSGHGAEYANPNAVDQPNNANQIICPVDFDWSPSRMIMDVQFAAIFKTFPAGVKFNWVSDSCNSGDLTRAILKPKTKVRQYPIEAPEAVRIAISKCKNKSNSRGMINGILDVGYISGCKSDQTSADAYIDGRYNGALTYYLLKELNANKSRKISDVVREVNTQLQANGFDQDPVSEGARISVPLLE